jgi:hypothetical protein
VLAAVGGSLVAAGSAITGPLMAAASVFNTMGSEMADMSARTGASVETLSKLKYAAEQSGAGVGDLEKALRTMSKKGMKAEDLGKVADYIAGISDPAKQSAEAMRLADWNATVSKLVVGPPAFWIRLSVSVAPRSATVCLARSSGVSWYVSGLAIRKKMSADTREIRNLSRLLRPPQPHPQSLKRPICCCLR